MPWRHVPLTTGLILAVLRAGPAWGYAPPLKVPLEPGDPSQLEAEFFPANGGPPLAVRVELAGNGVELPGLCGQVGTLVLEGSSVVSEPLTLTGKGSCEVKPRWFPKAKVTARVVGNGGEVGRLKLVRPEVWPEVAMEYPVQISEQNQVVASVPAGAWHLRLTVGNHVPLAWGLQNLTAGQEIALPQATLRSGPYLAVSFGNPGERKPVAGVRVWCVPEDEHERLWCALRDPKGVGVEPAVSDGSGWAVCPNLKADQRYLVGALTQDGVPWLLTSEPVETTPEPLEAPVPLPAVVTIHLPESLRDFPRSPQRQIRAELSPKGTFSCPLEAPFEEGRATLTQVPPGDYTLMVTSQVLNENVVLNISEVSIFPGEDRHLQANLGEVLAGRLEEAGDRPICLLKPYLWEKASLKQLAPALTDSKGFFIIPAAVEGTWAFEVRCPNFTTFLPQVQVTPAEFLVLKVPKGKIRGRLLDKLGLPLRDRTVSISPGAVDKADTLLRDLLQAYLFVHRTTREDGRFEFSHLPAGEYLLECLPDNNSRGKAARRVVRLEDGQTLEVDLAAEPFSVTLAILGQAGPVAGAHGWLIAVPENGEFAPTLLPFETDSSGKAEIVWPSDLVPRWVHVTAFGLPFYPAQAFRIELPPPSEAPEPIPLVLRAGPGGFLELPASPNLVTYLRTAEGAVLQPVGELISPRKPISSEPSRLLLGPILPGHYEVASFPVSPESLPRIAAFLRGEPAGGQWVWVVPGPTDTP